MTFNHKPEMKPGQFKEVITKPIKIVLDNDTDRFKNGFLYMAITSTGVSEGDKKLGDIRMDIQGTTVHMNLENGRTWSISIKELVPLFLEADAKYSKGLKPAKVK